MNVRDLATSVRVLRKKVKCFSTSNLLIASTARFGTSAYTHCAPWYPHRTPRDPSLTTRTKSHCCSTLLSSHVRKSSSHCRTAASSSPLCNIASSMYQVALGSRSSSRLSVRSKTLLAPHLTNHVRSLSSQSSAPTLANPQRLERPLEWSYASFGGEEPLSGLTMGQVITRARDQFGDREAVVSMAQRTRATYDQLYSDSVGVAAGLVASGLKVGDRVGLWSGNCYEWVVTQWAAALAGLVLVNINPSYIASELAYCLKKVDVKALVMGAQFKDIDLYAVLQKACPQVEHAAPNRLHCPDLPNLRTVVLMGDHQKPGTMKFSELPHLWGSDPDAALRPLADLVQFDDPCNIQFTSGTTGSPKAAMLTHHNIVNNGHCIGRRSGYHLKPYRLCLPVPLYHCFGCVAGTIAGALHGATCILPSPNFSGRAAYAALMEEGATSCYGTPTMFVDILSAAREARGSDGASGTVLSARAPPSLTAGIMAGAPCPPELVQAVVSELGMKDFMVMYGLTETSPVVLQCSPSDPLNTRSQTVGYPGDHIEVKVVDGEGRVVKVGEEGELWVRGYAVFLGYWGDEAKTSEVVSKDRWFKTGDLAAMDKSGYCSIRGRKNDMIIRGGENIYPAELENIFMTHPQVLEAQVFGIPDARLGEVVVAWLRLNDGSDVITQEQFQQWCKDKVAVYKIPVHVFIKETFPVTVTGKIQKFKMRDDTIKEIQGR